jgi:hypothetical protein
MIRMDANVDLLIERQVRTLQVGNRRWAAPIRSNQRREQKASHPSEVLE